MIKSKKTISMRMGWEGPAKEQPERSPGRKFLWPQQGEQVEQVVPGKKVGQKKHRADQYPSYNPCMGEIIKQYDPDQDERPVPTESAVLLCRGRRENVFQDVGAVKRRKGQQVEDAKPSVHEYQPKQGLKVNLQRENKETDEHSGEKRHTYIGEGAGQ